jgi:hypothetical protein
MKMANESNSESNNGYKVMQLATGTLVNAKMPVYGVSRGQDIKIIQHPSGYEWISVC